MSFRSSDAWFLLRFGQMRELVDVQFFRRRRERGDNRYIWSMCDIKLLVTTITSLSLYIYLSIYLSFFLSLLVGLCAWKTMCIISTPRTLVSCMYFKHSRWPPKAAAVQVPSSQEQPSSYKNLSNSNRSRCNRFPWCLRVRPRDLQQSHRCH